MNILRKLKINVTQSINQSNRACPHLRDLAIEMFVAEEEFGNDAQQVVVTWEGSLGDLLV